MFGRLFRQQFPQTAPLLSRNLSHKATKIVHLAQFHESPLGNPSNDVIDDVVTSQLYIAHQLLAYPERRVFVESLTENSDAVSHSNAMYDSMQNKFPDRLPKDIKELDFVQKEILYTYGAPRVLYYLGALSHIYRTISPGASNIIDQKISTGAYEYIFEPREKAAIACIKAYTAQIKPEVVFLVFGADHDFSKLCEQHHFLYEKHETHPSRQHHSALLQPRF